MRRCLLLILLAATPVFGQDVESLLGKIKGVKTLTAKVRMIDSQSGEESEFCTVISRFSEAGDVTEYTLDQLGGSFTYQFAYSFDEKLRKTEAVKKLGALLKNKATYKYAADSSYVMEIQEYDGEKPGKEKPGDLYRSEFNAAGQLIVQSRKYAFFQVTERDENKYDAAGFLIETKRSHDGELKNVLSYENDAKGLPVKLTTKDHAGKLMETETFAYNEKGDLTDDRVFDPSGKLSRRTGLSYRYNARGDKEEFTYRIYGQDAPDKPSVSVRAMVSYEYYKK